MTTRRGFFGMLAGILGAVVLAKPLMRSAGEARKPDDVSQEIPRAYSTAGNSYYEKTWFINHAAITGEHWIQSATYVNRGEALKLMDAARTK